MINKLKNISLNDIKDINTLGGFYPISSKDNISQSIYDSKSILGLIIRYISKQKIKKNFNTNEFKNSCRDSLINKIYNERVVDIICKTYFDSNLYLNISPLMYQIHKTENRKDKSKIAFEIVFKPFLNGKTINIDNSKNINFIEKNIIECFKKHCIEEDDKQESCSSYLDFFKEVFVKDFEFLLNHEEYFLENVDRFIKFYIFTYTAQLALNLKPYFLEKPTIRELYFILNGEKTSQERKKLVKKSYKTLFEKVGYIFPYLSMLERLSNFTKERDLRLYQLLNNIKDTAENIEIIDEFTIKFREKRNLEYKNIKSENIEMALRELFNSGYEEFFSKSNSKQSVFKKYKNAFEKQIAKNFIQSRGRFGKVCVLDQEMVLFLTNLSIGNKNSLHFEELILEFERRGVFFDYKSKEALLALFERVENIERKSDSGDSIYVYKTI